MDDAGSARPVRVKAAVYRANDDVRVETVDRPVAGEGEILLRVAASGVCGSDVMEWYRKPKAPIVLGHEVAGVVEEAGPGAGFSVGDRVVATHHVPCGTCLYCRTDRESVCETLRATSFDPGGFAEFVRVPALQTAHGALRVPDAVSLEAASFVEPLACVVRALRHAGPIEGRRVAVLGAGISGALAIRAAKAYGAAHVVATDVVPFRLEAASAGGADDVFDARASVADARVPDRAADVVFATTAAPSAIEDAFRIVDRGGTVVPFAPMGPGETLALPMLDLWRDSIRVVHSYAGPPRDMREALDLIADGRVDVVSTITHRVGLAETGLGFRLVAEAGDSLKVIVEPQRQGSPADSRSIGSSRPSTRSSRRS